MMGVGKKRNLRWAEMDKSEIPLQVLIEQFDTHNQIEGKSPKTRAWYNSGLEQFQRYLEGEALSTKLGDIDIHDVQDFILYLQSKDKWDDHPTIRPQGQGVSPISIRTKVRAIRAFFAWLHREGYTEENLLAKLKPPKAPRKLVRVLTWQEIGTLVAAIDQKTTAGARNFAILTMLLDTGLRLSEIANLEMGNVLMDNGYAKVFGKGGKERIVPMGATVTSALQRYVSFFRGEPAYPDIQKVFLTLEGLPMSKKAVYLALKRLGEKVGVERLHPHLCRHTFAVNYLMNGGDIFSLQQILGHTTLEMVRRYVNLASSQVIVQHRKFSPMDRLRLKVGRSRRLRARVSS